MSLRADDLRDWLDSLDKDAEVGVDDGGLILRVVGDPEPYCEVGGLPRGGLMEDREYEFTVRLRGMGTNPDEAWNDACARFVQDPGTTPEGDDVQELGEDD